MVCGLAGGGGGGGGGGGDGGSCNGERRLLSCLFQWLTQGLLTNFTATGQGKVFSQVS